MPLSYEDLIEPTIVKQVSKSVAYCRCTRTKNPPFCDGSHVVTSITPHVLEFDEPVTIAISRCWKTKDYPFFHGSLRRIHSAVSAQGICLETIRYCALEIRRALPTL